MCQNTKYKDMTEATQRPDGLAVLAVWFEVGTARSRRPVELRCVDSVQILLDPNDVPLFKDGTLRLASILML